MADKGTWTIPVTGTGEETKNIKVQETAKTITIQIDKTYKTFRSKNDKPMLASSRGFVRIGDFNLNLNLMDKRGN